MVASKLLMSYLLEFFVAIVLHFYSAFLSLFIQLWQQDDKTDVLRLIKLYFCLKNRI